MPLAVNNRPGQDRGLLARYEEPALNNPVVRFFAADGRELLPRRAGVWEASATAERMVAALRSGGHPVPEWLELAQAELSEKLPERAVFGMSCFWQGQAALGSLEGVLAARPGWLGGEVVEVLYDPRVIDFETLVRVARARGCGARVLTEDEERQQQACEIVGSGAAEVSRAQPRAAPDSDDLWHLRRSPLWHLPLTPLQALRVNGALAERADARRFLAPFQLALLARLEAALQRDEHALDGLERPARFEDLGELERYRRALAARL